MKVITAKDAKNAFGEMLDTSQREPVVVTKHDRPVSVMFAVNDFAAMAAFVEQMNTEINAGISLGIVDAEAGRVSEVTDEYVSSLQAKLRQRLARNDEQ